MIEWLFGSIDFMAGLTLAVCAMLIVHQWRPALCALIGHDDWTDLRQGAPIGGMQHMVAVDVCRRCGREVADA